MIRTQIQLREGQVSRLKKLASVRRTSMAELIRQAIDLLIKTGNIANDEDRMRRAASAAGRFRSGIGDLSRKHDKYLEDAFKR